MSSVSTSERVVALRVEFDLERESMVSCVRSWQSSRAKAAVREILGRFLLRNLLRMDRWVEEVARDLEAEKRAKVHRGWELLGRMDLQNEG